MPLTPRKDYQVPDFWTVFGHSFMQYSFGTYYQTGRADSLLRGSLDIEHSQWQNYAVNGARACIEGGSTGGYERFFKRVKRPTRGAPYVSDGGALLLCYGINDLGMVHLGASGTDVQVRSAITMAMRTMISMWRASVIYENNFQVGTRTSYGAGFTAVGVEYSTNGSVHWCTDTTPDADDTFTLTLPSDYGGEPIGINLVGGGGLSGGTVTWSGTAGVTGTTSVSNILPSAAASHCPVLKRITNLTSANAGQTIVGTVTAMDSGGAVMLDSWWLESKEPPPVIVCDVTRLPAAGYTANYPSWTGTESSRDTDVNNLNADFAALVAEFDSMVQIARTDAAINKDSTLFFSDNLHPTERGAARIVDSIRDAMRLLTPTSTSPTANFNPSAPRAGGSLRPRISGQFYTADHTTAVSAGVTPLAGDMWAIPVWVTQGREFWQRLALKTGTATGATGTTSIRWGLYDDVGWSGYPRELVGEATSAGALAISTSATTLVLNPVSQINWVLDPGLYWLCLKITVQRTTPQQFTSLQGPNLVMPNASSAGDIFTTSALFPNGYKLTGQGTGALWGTFPQGAAATVNAPYVGAQVFINPTNS
jgi:hypothetical protein